MTINEATRAAADRKVDAASLDDDEAASAAANEVTVWVELPTEFNNASETDALAGIIVVVALPPIVPDLAAEVTSFSTVS